MRDVDRTEQLRQRRVDCYFLRHSKGAVLRLLLVLGMLARNTKCDHPHVSTKRVQVDEIWSFCYANKRSHAGDSEQHFAGRRMDVHRD